MGSFDMSGVDEMIKAFSELGESADEIEDEMLMAGAEEEKKAQIQSAEKHKLRDSGDMIKSIGYAKKPKTAEGLRQIDIYPQGKDKKGVRNAEKGFIHHYGTSVIKATHWVDEADEAAAEPVQKAMEAVLNKGLKEKGMI